MTTCDNAQLCADLERDPRCFARYSEDSRGADLQVGRLDTHISTLLFVDQHVYKIKKAILTPFLDFSTLELRRHFCAEEVRLNRRLAPDVYCGVVPIWQHEDGTPRVGLPDSSPGAASAAASSSGGKTETDSPPVVEYAVEMRLLPRHQMMDARLDRGEVDNLDLNRLVDLLVEFHGAASTGEAVDPYGTPDAVAAVVTDNVRELAPYIEAGLLTKELQLFLEQRATDFLSSQRSLLETRVQEGRIRDGHGDLHAANICLRDSDIVVYDCIEFSPRFRCGDVAADLAFLAMDLDLRRFRGFSRYLVHRYAQVSGDHDLQQVVDFYKAHRALVRAKVAGIQAAACSEPAAAAKLLEHGREYVHLAVSYSFPTVLIITCGLPASGKSWAAHAVAQPFEAAYISSDIERTKLPPRQASDSSHGESIEELSDATDSAGSLDAGRYAPQEVERVYRHLRDRASTLLADRRSVVVDATFGDAERRASFVALGAERGVPVVILHRICDDGEATGRLEARANRPSEPSEADARVRDLIASRFEAPVSEPGATVVTVGTVADPTCVAQRVLHALVATTH